MPKIVLHGVTYTPDASVLTTGSDTMTQNSGVLEALSIYQRGDATTGNAVAGTFKIFSGTTDPDAGLGQNGDIYLKRVSA